VIGRASLLLVLLAALLVPASLAAAQQAAPLDLAIRDTRLAEDGTTEIVVNVTGTSVPDVLDAGAFAVTEQGEPVDGLSVEPFLRSEGGDVVVTVVVDLSGSMRGEPLETTRLAVAGLSRTLTDAGARVQLITFASEIRVVTEATDDLDALLGAAAAFQAGGETPLYDAIVLGAEELDQLDGQRNLLVFSDGGDTSSEVDLDAAIAAVNEVGAETITVALETDDLDPAALQRFATETEGRLLTAEDLDELEELFGEVARDIASQYLLVYTSDRLEPASLDLGVEVIVAGESTSASFVIPNPREAAPRPPQAVQPSDPLVTGQTALLAGLLTAFVALILLLYVVFTGGRTRADKVLDEQLSRYIQGGDTKAGRSTAVATHFRERALQVLDASPRPKGFDQRLARSLEQAGWPLRNVEFIALVLALGLGSLLLFGLLFNWLGGLMVAAIAGTIPVAILNRKKEKRRSQFLKVLPDTLQLMAGSLRAGYGVLQSIDSVAKETTGPTAEEFGRVLTEARLGMPLDLALADMANRIDNDDFRWVVLAITIQREVGGNLAELLETVAGVLREREMLRRQVRVLSAEGRLSAIVLIGLPIFLAIYLTLVNPTYIGVLVTSGLVGWSMIVVALILMLIGVIWIRRLIQIEV
jgi:tight adherence protein B